MKKLISLTIFILTAMLFSNCEKDDICDENTPTTPLLVIDFYDVANPTVAKNVTNLGIVADGVTEPLGIFNNVSTISIPLRTIEDITAYSFILNSTNLTLFNEDKITFNYTRNNIFISRACGYKTQFILDGTSGAVRTDAATPDGLWIQNIAINQANILSEDETHVNIYF